nr:MAG TPA: hypothetical protein [Bacteriophage sp.]
MLFRCLSSPCRCPQYTLHPQYSVLRLFCQVLFIIVVDFRHFSGIMESVQKKGGESHV